MVLFLQEKDVQQILTMEMTLQALEEAFREQGLGKATNRPRSRIRVPHGILHLMSAGIPSMRAMGYKAYTSFREGTRFHFLLYDTESGRLEAIMEADWLGKMRTGAASGLATKYMAREDAHTLGLFGTGWQASTQVQAICAVRNITQIKVYSRNPERRQRFVQEIRPLVSAEVLPVEKPEEAVKGMDIIATITNARTPVFQGEWLEEGTHINAAGSNALIRQEIDETTVQRSSRIIVDSIEQSQIESGDLMIPIEKGKIYWESVHELKDVVTGAVPGRTSPQEITLFKSNGIALEDVATAARVYAVAKAEGIGQELPL
ncbi:MAG: ornithine cyclodeaminase family protein [Nitrospinota bacterium]|nr:MAG: ornithine cyclodeaminase family protein [Nitrospinota bacterium]